MSLDEVFYGHPSGEDDKEVAASTSEPETLTADAASTCTPPETNNQQLVLSNEPVEEMQIQNKSFEVTWQATRKAAQPDETTNDQGAAPTKTSTRIRRPPEKLNYAFITEEHEPTSFQEAMKHMGWAEAVNQEYNWFSRTKLGSSRIFLRVNNK